VGHWFTAVTGGSNTTDVDQVRAMLSALCYGLVAPNRALQHVFVDAHLGHTEMGAADRGPDPADRDRIRGAVASRDVAVIRAEVFRLLGPGPLDPAVERAVREGVDDILGRGVRLVRARGWDGARHFLDGIQAWIPKVRRRGGTPVLRATLNYFSYLAKSSFYLAYANLWLSLVPWLKEHRGLDPVSEQFLRFWHYQNQPGVAPDGAAVPDVFAGQVLSLHHLSAIFMRDPLLCATAGQFFGTAAHDAVFRHGQAASCDRYWRLVDAILTAAATYRRCRAGGRPDRGRRKKKAALPAGPGPRHEVAERLTRAAAAAGWTCGGCGGRLTFRGPLPTTDGATAALRFHCGPCRSVVVRDATKAELCHAFGVG
jgi:hypothetical protein